MVGRSAQMESGKAFEYAILSEFKEKLERNTNVEIVENSALTIAKDCFDLFTKEKQGRYLLTASFAVNFLIDIEPRLSNGIGEKDIIQLEILTDHQGRLGDVRDVLVIRSLQKWEIGISAKNNHRAVKHSRLSKSLDFGAVWLCVPCSSEYFDAIGKVFEPLQEIKTKSGSTQKWTTLENKVDDVYVPVLNAFKKELLKIHKNSSHNIAGRLVEHLVGSKDFYKVISIKDTVEIHAYNLYGTLNKPFQKIKPKYNAPIIHLPTDIVDINFKKQSKNTLIVKLNNGWELSFRIHNASSRIEPSLKFDINMLSTPPSLFINKLSISEENQ